MRRLTLLALAACVALATTSFGEAKVLHVEYRTGQPWIIAPGWDQSSGGVFGGLGHGVPVEQVYSCPESGPNYFAQDYPAPSQHAWYGPHGWTRDGGTAPYGKVIEFPTPGRLEAHRARLEAERVRLEAEKARDAEALQAVERELKEAGTADPAPENPAEGPAEGPAAQPEG